MRSQENSREEKLMSCVTWHLPPPPLGPGPDQQGVCVAVCVHLKRLRGGGKVVMYVYMLGCSVSPLPASHFISPPFLVVAVMAATPRGKWTKATRQQVSIRPQGVRVVRTKANALFYSFKRLSTYDLVATEKWMSMEQIENIHVSLITTNDELVESLNEPLTCCHVVTLYTMLTSTAEAAIFISICHVALTCTSRKYNTYHFLARRWWKLFQ